jgi:Secretion system C-terminal sorting domain
MFMKLKQMISAAGFFIFCLFANQGLAQTLLPANFQQNVQTEYNAMTPKEITYDKYYQSKLSAFIASDRILAGLDGAFNGCAAGNTACGNGNFESGLNTAEWSGAYGFLFDGPNANPATMTAGFSPLNLPLNDENARHTIVTAGTDPITGVSLVAPGGSTKALRLGNSVNGYGTELISKRITVTAGQTILSFSYATVLQFPTAHATDDQPTFRVRVIDCATGQDLSNVCNLGNNSNEVIANQNNPFFTTIQYQGEPLVYTQWLCAQINLSQHIGKTVSILFINEDCALGGHFGYTYLDNLCTTSNCSTGTVSVGSRPSCGPGQICINYTLPQINGQTGTTQIALRLYQNGVLVQTLNSPVLSTGTSYCFTVNPTSIPSINTSLAGYDFVATGNFAINGFSLAPIAVGNPPTGQMAGQNNDVNIFCINQCCPGSNLIANPGFELGNQSFTSAYTFQPVIAANTVGIGRYGVMTSAQGLTVSPAWNVNCPTFGRHLYVNGATGQSTAPKLVWQQTVTVSQGKYYKFCVDMKNLAQCAFDVKPKVNVNFSIAGFNLTNRIINLPPFPSCFWLPLDQIIKVPAGSGTTTLTIRLDETGISDGNDLAIDNISLVEIPQVPQSQVLFNVNFINVTATSFGLSATPLLWPAPDKCSYSWEVAEVDANNQIVPGTAVFNPDEWKDLYPNTFPGYKGTDQLSGSNDDGVFDINKRYRIIYRLQCPCEGENSYAVIVDPKNKTQFVSSFSSLAENGQSIQGFINSNELMKALQKTAAAPIAGEAKATAMQVYPNPANDDLIIVLPKDNAAGQLIIFDAQGTVINRAPVASKQNRKHVNISALSAGNYVVQFTPADGAATERQKFVKLGK